MKRFLALALVVLALPAQADQTMDIILQQGRSAYAGEDYQEAMNHFSAALVHAINAGESTAYPGSYLCAIWYHGRGVERDLTRAERACELARGSKSDYQLELFQEALAKNSAPESTQTFKKAMGDAAAALKWYLGDTGGGD